VNFEISINQISLYVNQNLKGTIDLLTFAGGIYDNYSNQWVGAGAGLAAGENRTWTDNFQVGSAIPEPATATLLAAGFVIAGLCRRREARPS